MKLPMLFALGILGTVAIGTAIASAGEIKMPTFKIAEKPQPATLFFPPVKGANTMVAFGGSCMDQDAFQSYLETRNLEMVLMGSIANGQNFGLFTDNTILEVAVGDGKGHACLLTRINNITFPPETGE